MENMAQAQDDAIDPVMAQKNLTPDYTQRNIVYCPDLQSLHALLDETFFEPAAPEFPVL